LKTIRNLIDVYEIVCTVIVIASGVGDMDSMFDEEASSDDDETVNSDVRTIRKQLEGLETMYSEVRN